jgi:TniQ
MLRRWPIHPIPYRAEALSSWLSRIAVTYDMTLRDLLVYGLAVPPFSKRDLDIDPPEVLFGRLEECTGIVADRVRRMTAKVLLAGYTEPTSGQELFDGYAARYSVLLPSRRGSFEEIDHAWQPWISNDRMNEPWVCESCLGASKPHVKLQWKLPVALSCPEHRLFLKPIGFVGNIDLRPVCVQRRTPPAYVLQLDTATEQAMLGNEIRLGTVCIPADVWFPLLRSLLTELNASAARAGKKKHHILLDVWSRCNMRPRVGLAPGWAFEDLSPEHQACFLEAAALAINLISNGKQHSRGRDRHVVRPIHNHGSPRTFADLTEPP